MPLRPTKILSSLPASRNGSPNTVNINRDWHIEFTILFSNMISGLDFNPTGEYVATIDEGGVCLISDVNKNDPSFCAQFPSRTFGEGNFEC